MQSIAGSKKPAATHTKSTPANRNSRNQSSEVDTNEKTYIRRRAENEDEEDDFVVQDIVRFGETADRPPDLTTFTVSIDAKYKKQQLRREMEANALNASNSIAAGQDGEELSDEEDVLPKSKRPKASMSSIYSADDSELVTSLHSSYTPLDFQPYGKKGQTTKATASIAAANNNNKGLSSKRRLDKSGPSALSGSTIPTKTTTSASEMEELRKKVVAAYATIRQKRIDSKFQK